MMWLFLGFVIMVVGITIYFSYKTHNSISSEYAIKRFERVVGKQLKK